MLDTFIDTQPGSAFAAALPALDAIFADYQTRYHAPGLAYGVIANGELVYANGRGQRSPDHSDRPDAATVYRIASMTKSFTAAAIVMLRDEGRLALDCPAVDYVPELARLTYPTRDAAPITVRHLLTMACGWPEDDPWGDRQLVLSDAELSALLCEGVTFTRAPGVTFEYSNYGYMVLGRIIHNVSGRPAPAFICDRILRPLGMNDSQWHAADVPPDQLAPGQRWQDGDWLAEPMPPSGGDSAAFAGVFSSVRDLTRWVNLFLSAWPPRDEEDGGIIRRSSLREMQQGWRQSRFEVTQPRLGGPPHAAVSAYGYGLSVTDNTRYTLVSHSGGLPGFGSFMAWAPDYGLGIVALANLTYAPMRMAATQAFDALVTQCRPRPRPVLADQGLQRARADINRLLDHWDDALADRVFANNFFLDEPRPRWIAQLAALREQLGTLQPDGTLEPENPLRGSWKMVGERGWCRVWLSLAPTVPPRVQELDIRPVLLPDAALTTAAERLAACTLRPTLAAVKRLFAPGSDARYFYDQLRLVALLYGPCQVGEVLESDGQCAATFRLSGAKAAVDVAFQLNDRRTRIIHADFQPVNGA
jgi:CubicO group peptidase (beta-lactamase class C family)